MKDPGNPRAPLEDRQDRIIDAPPVDILGNMATVIRMLCLVGVFVMLVVAMFYAAQVFSGLARFVVDPSNATERVDQLEKLIGGDKLSFPVGANDRVEPGRAIAFTCLVLLYALVDVVADPVNIDLWTRALARRATTQTASTRPAATTPGLGWSFVVGHGTTT